MIDEILKSNNSPLQIVLLVLAKTCVKIIK